MAKRLEEMLKSVRGVLGERKRLEKMEKKLVSTLNRALARIGYKVAPAKAVAKKRRRRRARRATGTARRRRVTATPRRRKTAAGRRRKTGGARRRARAKKS